MAFRDFLKKGEISPNVPVDVPATEVPVDVPATEVPVDVPATEVPATEIPEETEE